MQSIACPTVPIQNAIFLELRTVTVKPLNSSPNTRTICDEADLVTG